MSYTSGRASITIYDIARESGVSYATVSRAINGHFDVKAETRERILETARRLNYRPRAIARGLTTRKSWLLGVAYHGEFDNPFFGRLLSSVKGTIEPAGYELLFFHDASGVGSDELVSRVRYRQIDGLLVAGVTQGSAAVQALADLEVPTVSINFRLSAQSSAVISQQFRGSWLMLEQLWRWGHRKIGMVTGDLDISSGLYRYAAYTRFLEKHTGGLRSDWILNNVFDQEPEESTYQMIRKAMGKSDPPTAWFCSEDRMAIGAMRACRDLGLDVPGDVSVTGFDDIDACRYVHPQLTTVRQNRMHMGRLSAERLLRQVESPDGFGETITVPTEIVIRGSAGPVR